MARDSPGFDVVGMRSAQLSVGALIETIQLHCLKYASGIIIQDDLYYQILPWLLVARLLPGLRVGLGAALSAGMSLRRQVYIVIFICLVF